jgi:hypothetical protein
MSDEIIFTLNAELSPDATDEEITRKAREIMKKSVGIESAKRKEREFTFIPAYMLSVYHPAYEASSVAVRKRLT